MRLHGTLVDRRDEARQMALLERVSLRDRAHDRVGTFSKGMQTRVGLALALVSEPELLILDEPMSGLDPLGRALVRTLLREEAGRGCTVLFSTHVLADVEALCDRVGIMREGRSIFAGTVADALGGRIGTDVAIEHGSLQRTDDVIERLGQPRHDGGLDVYRVGADEGLAAANALAERGAVVVSLVPVRATLEQRLLEFLGATP